MGKHYCTDCYFMFYHDEENFEDMDCSHGNAIPENGSPEIINGCDPNNCPFFEWRDGE